MKDWVLQSPNGVIFFTPKVTLIPDQKKGEEIEDEFDNNTCRKMCLLKYPRNNTKK